MKKELSYVEVRWSIRGSCLYICGILLPRARPARRGEWIYFVTLDCNEIVDRDCTELAYVSLPDCAEQACDPVGNGFLCPLLAKEFRLNPNKTFDDLQPSLSGSIRFKRNTNEINDTHCEEYRYCVGGACDPNQMCVSNPAGNWSPETGSGSYSFPWLEYDGEKYCPQ